MSLAALSLDRPLWWSALAHMILALACLLLLAREAPSIMGVHPALKPLKFALSIALFLGTFAVILPLLQLPSVAHRLISWSLCLTMACEIGVILWQAARGTTSHFNTSDALNTVLWQLMASAIVVAVIVTLGVALLASVRSLRDGSGAALPPLLALAIRVGLWMFLLVAFTGFAMGGRAQHSVGGEDGGPGLPLTNWSTTHGDLRVGHFFALHALQAFPLVAGLVSVVPLPNLARWAIVLSFMLGWGALAVRTTLVALAGRPLW